MAQFEPGHLHIQRAALQPNDFSYDINLHYEVLHDASRGKYVHFNVEGHINDKPFKDEFDLDKNEWYNFASSADHIARRNGLPTTSVLSLSMHSHYDACFEDIRDRIGAQSGDAVSAEHLDPHG
ncbi:hypothetical protein PMM47T1_17725 [Pseudomonas sp. M47T1]|uniref:DUF5064 family protein n=1 Tax=unclassified Pseudomonas TaxID=196821 RepID=UPI00026067EA|nr:DUF5064 family protein [Pseudomonas sp. M47T1]EIK95358.1 hypothetical protein PMM47T1_17725 [Pseudomonas sp. M47T1]